MKKNSTLKNIINNVVILYHKVNQFFDPFVINRLTYRSHGIEAWSTKVICLIHHPFKKSSYALRF